MQCTALNARCSPPYHVSSSLASPIQYLLASSRISLLVVRSSLRQTGQQRRDWRETEGVVTAVKNQGSCVSSQGLELCFFVRSLKVQRSRPA